MLHFLFPVQLLPVPWTVFPIKLGTNTCALFDQLSPFLSFPCPKVELVRAVMPEFENQFWQFLLEKGDVMFSQTTHSNNK